MRRYVYWFFAAVIAGMGLATVFALGTAAVTAASYKSQVSIDEPVYTRIQQLGPAIKVAAGIGFVLGSGLITWIFATAKDPGEPSENDRSEV